MKKTVAMLAVGVCFLAGLILAPFFGCAELDEYQVAEDTGAAGSNVGLETEHPYVESVTIPMGPLTPVPGIGEVYEIIICFSEEMDQPTTDSAIGVYEIVDDVEDGRNQLSDNAEESEIANAWSSDGMEVRHYVKLPDNAQYVVKVASTATDLAGNGLDGLMHGTRINPMPRSDGDFISFPTDFESTVYPKGAPDNCDDGPCNVLGVNPRPYLSGFYEKLPDAVLTTRNTLDPDDGEYDTSNVQPDAVFRLVFATGADSVVAESLSGNIQLTEYDYVNQVAVGEPLGLSYSFYNGTPKWVDNPTELEDLAGGEVTVISSILLKPKSSLKEGLDYELTLNGGESPIINDWGCKFVDMNEDGDDETGVADDVLKSRFHVEQDDDDECKSVGSVHESSEGIGDSIHIKISFTTDSEDDDLMNLGTLTKENISVLDGDGKPIPFDIWISTELREARGETTVLWIICYEDWGAVYLSHRIADVADSPNHLDGNGDCLYQDDVRDDVTID